MKIINIILLTFLITFFNSYLFSEEYSIKFSNITWGASPNQIILTEGTPDDIGYDYGDNAKIEFDDDGNQHNIVSETVWINNPDNNADLLEYAKKNNISTEVDINNIITGNNKINFRYNNIPYFNFNSTVFLRFEYEKLDSILYIIDTKSLSITEKNDMANFLKNHFLQLYGSPDNLSLTKNNSFTYLSWYLDDTIVNLEMFLPQNNPRFKESYIDNVTVSYRINNID